jgi:hypothetical protein
MTQEEKELLLKDLCERLPYGVKVYNTTFKNPTIQTLYGKISSDEFLMEETYTSVGVDGDDFGSSNKRHYTGYIDFIKPYLRPMSSMTEEEKEELLNILFDKEAKYFYVNEEGLIDGKTSDLMKEGLNYPSFCPINIKLYIDFLLSHHFDYRGLIEKGLAIVAPEDMYNINNK